MVAEARAKCVFLSQAHLLAGALNFAALFTECKDVFLPACQQADEHPCIAHQPATYGKECYDDLCGGMRALGWDAEQNSWMHTAQGPPSNAAVLQWPDPGRWQNKTQGRLADRDSRKTRCAYIPWMPSNQLKPRRQFSVVFKGVVPVLRSLGWNRLRLAPAHIRSRCNHNRNRSWNRTLLQ